MVKKNLPENRNSSDKVLSELVKLYDTDVCRKKKDILDSFRVRVDSVFVEVDALHKEQDEKVAKLRLSYKPKIDEANKKALALQQEILEEQKISLQEFDNQVIQNKIKLWKGEVDIEDLL